MEIRPLRETDSRLEVRRIYEESWKSAYRGHCPPGVLGRHPRRALGGGPGSARMGYPRPDRGGAAGREVLYLCHIE
jgi:hypothetical protein